MNAQSLNRKNRESRYIQFYTGLQIMSYIGASWIFIIGQNGKQMIVNFFSCMPERLIIWGAFTLIMRL